MDRKSTWVYFSGFPTQKHCQWCTLFGCKEVTCRFNVAPLLRSNMFQLFLLDRYKRSMMDTTVTWICYRCDRYCSCWSWRATWALETKDMQLVMWLAIMTMLFAIWWSLSYKSWYYLLLISFDFMRLGNSMLLLFLLLPLRSCSFGFDRSGSLSWPATIFQGIGPGWKAISAIYAVPVSISATGLFSV